MSQWQGVARSNYVVFKDTDRLQPILKQFNLELIAGSAENTGKFCLLSNDENGGWAEFGYDEDGELIDFDPVRHLCPFLEQSQILVLVEIGHQKHAWLSGKAEAFSASGESVGIGLSDVYELAASHFNMDLQSITRASG
jgi:hypothetical protein